MARVNKLKSSIKDNAGIKKKKVVPKAENLGKLMSRFKDLEDILYPYVVNIDFVYEDMDFTIEEFADICGADLDELLEEISKVVYRTV